MSATLLYLQGWRGNEDSSEGQKCIKIGTIVEGKVSDVDGAGP